MNTVGRIMFGSISRLCAAALVLSVAGPSLAFAQGTAHAATDAGTSAQVKTVQVARHTLNDTVTAFGSIQPDPDHLTSITLPRAGLVSRLWVRLGQRVKAGESLLELDTAPNARMDYQQAKAAVDYARSEVSRIKGLFAEQLATREQVASAQRNLRDAEAKLAAQKQLGTNRAHEVVRAPFAGIVTQLNVTQGQRVQADTTAMLLASRDALVIALGVEQEDAVRIHPGMPVILTSVFRSEVRVDAQISAVHAMVNPKTRLVDVLVRIPKQAAASLVLDGTMQGNIILRTVDGLSVPRSAVLRDQQGEYVFIVRNGHARRVTVTTGLRQKGQVEILSGLKAGEQVVSLGNYELRDGMAVHEAKP